MKRLVVVLAVVALWTHQARGSVNGIDKFCAMRQQGVLRSVATTYTFVPDDFTLTACKNMAQQAVERGSWRPVCRRGDSFIMPVDLPSLELTKPIPPRPELALWDMRPGRQRPSAEDVGACASAW